MAANRTKGTLIDSGSERLMGVARGLGLDESSAASMKEVFRTMASSWHDLPASGTPAWPSDVCDDHSPYELSMTIEETGPQLRVLVEPMDRPASLVANRTASLRLHEVLRRNYGINLDRLHALENLLMPEEAQGHFVAWYSAAIAKGQAMDFKAYFNLTILGRKRAPELAQEAFRRIGFNKAWPTVQAMMERRGAGQDELVYFALDLSHRADARAKLYFRHHRATAEFVDEFCGVARHHKPGIVTEFCRQMGGGELGPYGSKGLVTCFNFTDPADERPKAVTAYFPVSHYAPNDSVIRQRISRYMVSQSLDTRPYEGMLDACAQRPLHVGTGIHTYAAVRWMERPRVTVYFSPETYGRQPERAVPYYTPPRPAQLDRSESMNALH
jgi:DMATS type aromatic prenyltransferase